MKLKGKAWKFGDDVDTDAIIPARYLISTDPEFLAAHCMEDANPEFPGKVRAGDLIVAGKNFGCGSSREHAPVAIKGATGQLCDRPQFCAHLLPECVQHGTAHPRITGSGCCHCDR